MDTTTCETCQYYHREKNHTGSCCNPNSEKYGSYTDHEETCQERMEK